MGHFMKGKTFCAVLQETCEEFAKWTSLAGVSNAAKSDHHLGRLMWLVLFFLGAAITVCNVFTVCTTYYAYTYQVNLDYKAKLEFPCVSICNQNRMSCYKIMDEIVAELDSANYPLNYTSIIDYPLLEIYNLTYCGVDGIGCPEVLKQYGENFLLQNKTLPHLLIDNDVCLTCNEIYSSYITTCNNKEEDMVSLLAVFWSYVGCTDEISLNYTTCPENNTRPRDPTTFVMASRMTISDRYEIKMKFLRLYHLLPASMKYKLGYSFDKFILNCSYMNNPCLNFSLHFNQMISPAFGVCYLFNFEGNKTMDFYGKMDGLNLDINVEERSYMPRFLTLRQGIRLAIHPPNTIPMFEVSGIDVPVNMATSIGLRKTETNRLKYPYEANCVSSWEAVGFTILNFNSMQTDGYRNFNYTQNECLSMCYQVLMVNTCGCHDILFLYGFTYKNVAYEGHQPCSYELKSVDNQCMDEVKVNFTNENTDCGCRAPCRETEYKMSFGISDWPASKIQAEYSEYFKHHLTQVKGNLLQLEVTYSYFSVEVGSQIPQYDGILQFLSTLGGTLALYLGISLILLAELVQFFISLIWNITLYVLGRHHLQQKEKMEAIKIRNLNEGNE